MPNITATKAIGREVQKLDMARRKKKRKTINDHNRKPGVNSLHWTYRDVTR